MKRTAQQSNTEGRIVIVSSGAHKWAYRENFDKIIDKSGYSCLGAYGQSKLANILHADELARRLKEEGVNLVRHNSIVDGIIKTLGKLVMKNVQQVEFLISHTWLQTIARGQLRQNIYI